jgi:hypothetical protein
MARKQRTPFTLKSGNATAFKNMGSYSPMMQTDATTTGATTTKTGLGKLLDDVKSLVQNVGGKLKEGKKAADVRKQEQKEKDKARTGLDRMERQGKSQYQLDQMDAKVKTKTVPVVVDTTTVGDANNSSVETATEIVTNKNIEEIAKEVIKGKYGNGKERKEALGSDYNAVQAEVNKIISRKK